MTSWEPAEIELLTACRAMSPPLGWSEIACRLHQNLGSDRTPESLRQKVIADEAKARIPGRRTKREWLDEYRSWGLVAGDGAYQRALTAAGGFSRPIRVGSGVVLIAMDGLPRPCILAACRCLASVASACPARRKAA